MSTKNGEEPPKKTNKPKKPKAYPKVPQPGEPPPGKTEFICRPYRKLPNGKLLYASTYGKEAWCFWV